MHEEYLREYLDWCDLMNHTLATEPLNTEPLKVIPEGIAVLGMGGSGIVGDVLHSLSTERLEIPLIVVKDFRLPRWVDAKWLTLAVSYSGDTVETLTCVNEALKRGAQVAVVASGGKLTELSKLKRLPYFRIPSGRTPRSSFPALLFGAIKLLLSLGINLGYPSRLNVTELFKPEEALRLGVELAGKLINRIPVFISATKYYPLALRAKDEFNENAKTIAKAEVYPEGFHNDVVGWEGWRDPISAVIFKEREDRMLEFLKELLTEVGVNTHTYELDEEYLQNVVRWSQVVGIASINLALQRGVDPKETRFIARYKEFLRRIKRK
ncbi:MAG: bifunctional phosphoglucose/phosphomannose isomerase [Zestosphaera sp.]